MGDVVTSRRARVVLAAGAVGVVVMAMPGAAQPPQPERLRVLWQATIGAPVDLPSTFCDGSQEGVRSEAMPLVGADPQDDSVLRATWSAHGEKLQMMGTSNDGGRTWTAAPVLDATSCSGGPSERWMSMNTLFDVGAGGAAYVGQSWVNPSDEPVFEYGIAVHRTGSGRPGGQPTAGDVSSQNAAVLADPDDPDHVSVAWMWIPQVPNPLTYAPLPNQVRFAESFDGGLTWSDHVVVHEAPPGELVVNPRLVRASDGGLVVLVDRGRLADLPGAQTGLGTAEFQFFGIHSPDGRQWAEPILLGAGEFYSAERPDEGPAPQLAAVKPDLASGPGNVVVAVWHDVTRTTVRLARSTDGGRTWAAAEDTVQLPGLPYQVAVAVDGQGTTGLLWYDLRQDVAGDDEWTVRPWAAAQGRDGRWHDSPVDEAFDLGAAQRCADGPLPTTSTCEPASHAGPLGVYQDLEGLSQGFGTAYTVAGKLAQDGFTDVRFARLRLTGPRG